MAALYYHPNSDVETEKQGYQELAKVWNPGSKPICLTPGLDFVIILHIIIGYTCCLMD